MSIQSSGSDTSPLDTVLSTPAALSSILSAIRPSAAPSENTSSSSGADILGGLLSNPEMLAKLPAMIETVKPLLKDFSAGPKAEEKQREKAGDRRVALLLALKPYLSKSRCDAIDYIIKICGITEMFR